ncbi:MAG TPA: SGNH/GDSL hydrolase family protein [Opitutaceae bacterium]
MNLYRSTRALCLGSALLSLTSLTALAGNYDQMVVFGDSLSDNGNLSAVAGPGVFSALDYDPSRATDGPTTTPASAITGVTVEQLNNLLGLSPLAPSIASGTNFAWGEATTASNGPDFLHGITPGTGFQVGAYLTATSFHADPNSLYVIWAGSNDLLNASSTADIQSAETQAIANLSTQVGALLSAGAKHIAWFNVPDLSLTPVAKSEGAVLDQQLHDSSLQFRSDWAGTIALLQGAFPSASITGIDTYSLIQALVSDPAKYGLTNVTDSAQGQVSVNPDEYLFWDDEHPTTKADSLLAEAAYRQLVPVPEPSGSVYLSGALLLVVMQRFYISRRRRNA